MEMFQVTPQYLPHLLGEPDYWAPGSFARSDPDGHPKSLGRHCKERSLASLLTSPEFFCQHPRWHLNTHDIPLSVYMTHNAAHRDTAYLIVCNVAHPKRNAILRRIVEAIDCTSTSTDPDPFMLHTLIAHEIFTEAKSTITPLRRRLYDQLDMVDKYAQNPSQKDRQKGELEDMTIQLHVISQDIDSKTASADMTIMIVRRLETAHQRYRQRKYPDSLCNEVEQTADALQYLAESIESQRRWVISYKARKDIAMNLVFHLVTQQDAATSATIAREAKADGNSMKVIAALTMVFLPGTFLSSVFGMSVMEEEKRWWLYVALTLPLTVFIIALWWLWQSSSGFLHHCWKSIFSSKRPSARAKSTPDEAIEV
ncbi:hypothetical protein D0860_06960 [Hortaea werneckii]|uniref:Uncharacterized protein n=1 Tax=Hortaea werneckii TaxID=91943 RepID=A0A3M7GPE4_HORWE|nr:hypothetical protein D0860_06960 [Hortaea werneckii]